ncbi:hypothetical protein VN12_08435 [Pirellula sp. SH-Sr6A]|uniref:hypothetical protein n=1 Tax=Pirellula sp. SH-Sr6A TaxID=1632865 RepID=UPI00078BD665|nr:hypothetical protein [Pirellula sp. SH-Sr6A]AMV32136.1 hypothetical protein VN12_08435 [Pirellula sp. SH-Sr6A]
MLRNRLFFILALIALFGGFLDLDALGQVGPELHKWTDKQGREIEGAFGELKTSDRRIVILVPKEISLDSLSPESQELANRLSVERKSDRTTQAIWKNETYQTEIYQIDEAKWGERDKDGKLLWKLDQRSRTKDFVELYHPERKQTWRLYKDRSEILDGTEWKWLSKGRWQLAPKPQQEEGGKQELGASKKAGQTTEWYKGGTLHEANALTWQKGSDADKLSTCGDFVSKLWTAKQLAPKFQSAIKSTDDIKVIAEELKSGLDAAFKIIPNEELNRRTYTNQEVKITAIAILMEMGVLSKTKR